MRLKATTLSLFLVQVLQHTSRCDERPEIAAAEAAIRHDAVEIT
jgi:hypothetical protein